jgi:DHA1 family tetracycline resistance protein-like MFS transporter
VLGVGRAQAVILLTLFIDMLGVGIAWPVLPKLVEQFLGGDIGSASITYGLLAGLYSLVQLVSAPVLGALSDRFGRRPVILAALAGLAIDYAVVALAPNLTWLFVGRFVAGLMGASYSAASAYLADVSAPEERANAFGLMGVAFGLGFMAGPVVGGFFGEIDLRLPFVVAAGFTALNFVLALFFLKESLHPGLRRSVQLRQMNPFGALRAVGRYPGAYALIATIFLVNLAERGLESVWVLFTDYRFGWGALEVGLSLGTMAFCP